MKSLLGLKHNALDVEVFIMAKTFKLNEAMRSNNLKKAALAYAEAEIPVFPLGKKGKTPLHKGGFHKATTDLKQIKKWWKQNPNANIGSPLVAGLIALDFDGDDGYETYKNLKLKKRTIKARTARGFHLYYAADLKSQTAAMEGLDLRGGGEGGYIILPPSIHPTGFQYKWNMPETLESLPERIALQFKKSGKKQTDKRSEDKPFFIPEGGRHKHMVSMAGYFRRKGYNDDQLDTLLLAANEVSFKKPLPDNEISKIASGCAKYKSLYDEFTTNLDDIEEGPLECVIRPYISKYDANILEGEPGSGKSTLLAEIASCITTGKEFCGIKPEVTGNVLFFAIEDNPNSVFKTRARLQGADFKKIDFVSTYLTLDAEGFEYLEEALSRKQYELVIIDTLTASLAGMRMNDAGDMAKLIRELSEIGRKQKTTFLVVRHFRKAGAENSTHLGMGSNAIMGAVRSAMMLKICPESEGKRYLAQNKSNGLKKGKTLMFTIQDAPNEDTEIGQLTWAGVSDLDDFDVMMLKKKGETEEERAEKFIINLLSQGKVKRKIIEQEAQEHGIANKTLERAKTSLGIKSIRIGKEWGWKMP